MHPTAFSLGRLPRVEFGPGSLAKVPDIVAGYGNCILLVTGSRSFPASKHWNDLIAAFRARDLTWYHVTVDGEPSPELVDAVVSRHAGTAISRPVPTDMR